MQNVDFLCRRSEGAGRQIQFLTARRGLPPYIVLLAVRHLHQMGSARGISSYSPHILPSLGNPFSNWRRVLSLIPVAAAVSLTVISS
jgi:hypothetical protein